MLDTLGQDRQFSPNEKRFILQTVQRFAQTWKEQEQRCLTSDRDDKLEQLAVDKAEQAEVMAAVTEEIEKKVEDAIAENEEASQSDDYKNLLSQ